MSLPIDNHQTSSAKDGRLIDQLVDGELSDVERRSLLMRLESEPEGWRRCALAFLEAQTWREAFSPLATSAVPVVKTRPKLKSQGRKLSFWRPVARLTALAASLAAAFMLGWVLHSERLTESVPMASVAQGVVPVPATSSQTLRSATTDRSLQEERPTKPLASPDPVVKQWEQRGFRVESQKRLLSMELENGQKIDIPIREVRLRYVGNRAY